MKTSAESERFQEALALLRHAPDWIHTTICGADPDRFARLSGEGRAVWEAYNRESAALVSFANRVRPGHGGEQLELFGVYLVDTEQVRKQIEVAGLAFIRLIEIVSGTGASAELLARLA